MRRPRAQTGSGGTGYSPLGAALDLWFARDLYSTYGAQQTLSQATTFSRASVADWLNAADDGLSPQAASGVLRRDGRGALIEESRTNAYSNGILAGAALPALPTGFIFFSANGLSATSVLRGTTNGVPWVDIRIQGTATNTFSVLSFAGVADIAASSGQTWTHSLFAALVGGSLANVSAVATQVRGIGTSDASQTNMSLSGTLVRQPSATVTLTLGATNVAPTLFITMTNGAAIDFTLRLGLPTLEQASSALSPILTSGSSATRAADVLTASAASLAIPDTTWTLCGVARMPTTPDNGVENFLGFNVDANNRIFFRRNGGGTMLANVLVAGANQGGATVTAPSLGARFSWALRRNAGELAISINGAVPTKGTPTSFPSGFSSISIGCNQLGLGQWNSFHERLIAFRTATDDATLQQYSTLATWGG